MKTETTPWYAHEFPDRPLVEGAHLCCCIPCAVSLERAGMEDAKRPIYVHTGTGVLECKATYLFWRREEGQLHDLFNYLDEPRINWITDIEVGPRHGRGSRSRLRDEGEPYPRPLADWRVCSHCGPLSSASFASVVPIGSGKRRSAKTVAADEASLQARLELEAKVLIAVEEQRERGWLARELHWARVNAGDFSHLDEPGCLDTPHGYPEPDRFPRSFDD